MIKGRTYLYLILGIGAALAAYLYYVDQERKLSVKEYVLNPKPGDIYKMQRDDDEQGTIVYYLKIKDIGKESIYFYHSDLVSDRLHNNFLKHFNDTTNIVVLSRKDLLEIRDNKWNNYQKSFTILREVQRGK